MGAVNNYQLQQIQKGNEIVLKIIINAKLYWWPLVASTAVIAILLCFLTPLVINEVFDLYNLFLSSFLLMIVFFYIKGCFWMIFGREEIVLSGNKVSYFKRIFNFSILHRKYNYIDTSNWSTDILYYYSNKSRLYNIYRMFYGSASYGIAFGLSDGKIIFKYNNKVYRFANNVSEEGAKDIIKIILKYFGEH